MRTLGNAFQLGLKELRSLYRDPALLVLIVVLSALVALAANVGDLVSWLTPFADDWADLARSLLRIGLALLVVIGAVLLARLRGERVAADTRLPFGALLALGAWAVWIVQNGV